MYILSTIRRITLLEFLRAKICIVNQTKQTKSNVIQLILSSVHSVRSLKQSKDLVLIPAYMRHNSFLHTFENKCHEIRSEYVVNSMSELLLNEIKYYIIIVTSYYFRLKKKFQRYCILLLQHQ